MQDDIPRTASPMSADHPCPGLLSPADIPLSSSQASSIGGDEDDGNPIHSPNAGNTFRPRTVSMPANSVLSMSDDDGGDNGERTSPVRQRRPSISPVHGRSSPVRRTSLARGHTPERHSSRIEELKGGGDDNFMADAVVPEMLPDEAIPFLDQTTSTPTEVFAPDSPTRTPPSPIGIIKRKSSWIAPQNPLGLPHSPRGSLSYPHSCSPLTTCLPLTPDVADLAPPKQLHEDHTAAHQAEAGGECTGCPDDVQTFMDTPKAHFHPEPKKAGHFGGVDQYGKEGEAIAGKSLGLQL